MYIDLEVYSVANMQHVCLRWCLLSDKMRCSLHLSFPPSFADKTKNVGLLEVSVKWQALVEPIYEPLAFLGPHQMSCYFVVISSYQHDDIIEKQLSPRM